MYRHLGSHLGSSLTVGSKGTTLIPESILRAGSHGLRLTLLEGEAANFNDVVEALTLLKDPKIDERLLPIVNGWAKVLAGQIHFVLDSDQPIGGKQILEAWLYGRLFHHDADRQARVQQLENLGEIAIFALQAAVLGLGRLLIALDRLIADLLDEPYLVDRIKPGDEKFF
jgi:hypothetical protein